ncbi:MAG: SDR family oxidoreductase [Acidimicrobiales bacterium]|jgi:NAD(P)-dependent dehydrogenase (short-subunit alcohol dehydrogenase family)
MSGRFEGSVAVVTGAASGLGRASAERLAGQGAHVVAVDLNGHQLRDVVDALPTESMAVEGDIAEESTVDRYMAMGVERFGKLDMYHLNAGIFGSFVPLPDVSTDEFDRVMAVNLRGQFLGLRAAFRQYRTQQSRGAVALTASIASLTGSADLLAYQTSKHGIVGLVHGAAMYGGPLGIRVNAVAPGIVPTELFAASASSPGGKSDMVQRASTTPLRRAGNADEIAQVVSFLLSEESSYITGQVISADGGATIVNTVRPSGGAGAWDTSSVDRVLYGGTEGVRQP